jgi:hypothetical protein
LTQDVMTEMRDWRAKHPKATLREMEQELDTRLNRMRARMLEDMALASAAADWTDTSSALTIPLANLPISAILTDLSPSDA